MSAPQQFPPACHSAGHAPLRRPGSIRRTTSIDSEWPEGAGKAWQLTGRARDLLTPFTGNPVVLEEASFRILASPVREILEIASAPEHPGVPALVGVRGAGASRSRIEELLGDLKGHPLYQLLDDYAGASLVATWIWSRWAPDWAERSLSSPLRSTAGRGGNMLNVCAGFAPGSSSIFPDGSPNTEIQLSTEVGRLENPDDPLGWHDMPVQSGPQKRRARRTDLWREGGLIHIDAGFQDSGSTPDGGRRAVHEYRVYAEIDEATGRLVTIQALPLVLPYLECPGASVQVARLVGQPVSTFRSTVLEALPSTLGCTHLNDVLRSLADVPHLVKQLPAEPD